MGSGSVVVNHQTSGLDRVISGEDPPHWSAHHALIVHVSGYLPHPHSRLPRLRVQWMRLHLGSCGTKPSGLACRTAVHSRPASTDPRPRPIAGWTKPSGRVPLPTGPHRLTVSARTHRRAAKLHLPSISAARRAFSLTPPAPHRVATTV